MRGHARFLLATMTLLLGQRSVAYACTPPRPVVPGTIISAYVGLAAGDAVPRNAGIPLRIQAAPGMTDAAIKAALMVEVTLDGAAIPGDFRRAVEQGPAPRWVWLPSAGDIAPGSLEVKLDFPGSEPPRSIPLTVSLRPLVPPPPTVLVDIQVQLVPDDSSPSIACDENAKASCATSFSREVRSRMRNAISVVPKYPGYANGAFLRLDTETFGRDKDGATSKRGGLDPIDRKYDEYCVHVTSSLLGSDSVAEDTQCIVKDVDLTLDAALMETTVKQQLSTCDTITYPANTSADDPTGTRKDSSGDGCVAARRASPPAGELTLAALGLALLASASRRRRATL